MSLKLVNVLTDEIAFDAVASDESDRFLHNCELPETWKRIEHHQQAMVVAGTWLSIREIKL